MTMWPRHQSTFDLLLHRKWGIWQRGSSSIFSTQCLSEWARELNKHYSIDASNSSSHRRDNKHVYNEAFFLSQQLGSEWLKNDGNLSKNWESFDQNWEPQLLSIFQNRVSTQFLGFICNTERSQSRTEILHEAETNHLSSLRPSQFFLLKAPWQLYLSTETLV